MDGERTTVTSDQLRLQAEMQARFGSPEPRREGSNAIPLSQEEHQEVMKDLVRLLPAFARCAGVAR